jgi:hypothetical protein
MPETPPAIRGQLYTTHLYARCYEYHQCFRCKMCQNYNQHNSMCRACESGKPGARHHTCTDDQQVAIVMLEKKLGRPLYDINADPARPKYESQDVMTTGFEPGNKFIANELGK